MVRGHMATVTDTWRVAPRGTCHRQKASDTRAGRSVKRSAGWQDVTGMATQASPALSDFGPTTGRARTAWMAASVPELSQGLISHA